MPVRSWICDPGQDTMTLSDPQTPPTPGHVGHRGSAMIRRATAGMAVLMGAVLGVVVLSSSQPARKPVASDGDAGARSRGPHPIKPGWWEERREIYNGIPTRILINTSTTPQADPQRLLRLAWQRFEDIGQAFNAFNPASQVGRINATDKQGEVLISSDMVAVLRDCYQIHALSNGAFDVTVWPLKSLWKSAVKRQAPPTSDEIQQAVARVGLSKVHIADETRRTLTFDDPRIQLDFGGIIKGWAVDRVRELLQAEGIAAALVQCGGEISAFGQPVDASWNIGVQHPLTPRETWGTLRHPQSLRCSTSGNYQQPLMIQGRAYYHIFDPSTGQPVPERVASVTLAAFGNGGPSNAQLDAAATAVAVMGSEQGLALARRLGAEALILVDNQGTLTEHRSAGLTEHYLPGADAR